MQISQIRFPNIQEWGLLEKLMLFQVILLPVINLVGSLLKYPRKHLNSLTNNHINKTKIHEQHDPAVSSLGFHFQMMAFISLCCVHTHLIYRLIKDNSFLKWNRRHWISFLHFCCCFDFQAISRLCDDKYKDLRKQAKKRSVSADNLTVVRWCPAIIS